MILFDDIPLKPSSTLVLIIDTSTSTIPPPPACRSTPTSSTCNPDSTLRGKPGSRCGAHNRRRTFILHHFFRSVFVKSSAYLDYAVRHVCLRRRARHNGAKILSGPRGCCTYRDAIFVRNLRLILSPAKASSANFEPGNPRIPTRAHLQSVHTDIYTSSKKTPMRGCWWTRSYKRQHIRRQSVRTTPTNDQNGCADVV